jgi:transcriptional regulator with XRE-family HTH domain
VAQKVPNSALLKRIGGQIRAARTARGWSQEALANEAGLDRSYVSGLERGEFNVSVLTLARIAKKLGLRTSRLLEDAERN